MTTTISAAIYEWLPINSDADYDRLAALLEPDFGPQEVSLKLKGSISPAVRGVLIERDYVDKDYRSTFYHFYAKKGRRYRDDCVRLHLFDETVSFDADKLDIHSAGESVRDHYFGYLVLRPTITGTIGRSILPPDVRTGASGMVIQARHKVSLLGYSLTVWGFPSMAQHTDISVCAHVSCWAILRHYSRVFPQHREVLIHEVTKMASAFDPGGLTPSLGLNVPQAERIFQAAGGYPLTVRKSPSDEAEFYTQMLAYLESGFPLFIAMHRQQHAVVAVGHAWRTPALAPPLSNSHAWDQVASVLVVDDNHLPYRVIEVGKATAPPLQYTTGNFDSFTVSLPDKIFYPADAVARQAVAASKLVAPVIPMPAQDELVLRYFVTTISDLRRYARDNQSQMGDKLVAAIMQLRTAQYVWMVEYASAAQWSAGHIAARMILDATASPRDAVPMWMVHGHDKAIFFDRSSAASGASVIELGRSGGPLGRMEQNLRPVRPYV